MRPRACPGRWTRRRNGDFALGLLRDAEGRIADARDRPDNRRGDEADDHRGDHHHDRIGVAAYLLRRLHQLGQALVQQEQAVQAQDPQDAQFGRIWKTPARAEAVKL